MSEQIREQVSAFLDGELPGTETELLLKRLTRVNLAIDGEPMVAQVAASTVRDRRWWRPLAGVTVAAGVAAVAIVALQQRAISPGLSAPVPAPATAQSLPAPREALSYTVPASSDAPAAIAPARLTNYVFAHSKYSSGLGRRGLLADLLIEDEEPEPIAVPRAPPASGPEARVAP
jgi:negative regulator of sigma E activity